MSIKIGIIYSLKRVYASSYIYGAHGALCILSAGLINSGIMVEIGWTNAQFMTPCAFSQQA
jgi:hypothetical protein